MGAEASTKRGNSGKKTARRATTVCAGDQRDGCGGNRARIRQHRVRDRSVATTDKNTNVGGHDTSRTRECSSAKCVSVQLRAPQRESTRERQQRHALTFGRGMRRSIMARQTLQCQTRMLRQSGTELYKHNFQLYTWQLYKCKVVQVHNQKLYKCKVVQVHNWKLYMCRAFVVGRQRQSPPGRTECEKRV